MLSKLEWRTSGPEPRFRVHVADCEDRDFEVLDLQGNHTRFPDALTAFDSFHFEVHWEQCQMWPADKHPFISLDVVEGTKEVRIPLFRIKLGPADRTPHQEFRIFRSIDDSSEPTRIYEFYPGYNVFYSNEEDRQTRRPKGVEFCIHNTHMRRDQPERDPNWELALDDDAFFKDALPNCRGMPMATPWNPVYGSGIDSADRAQGSPFWYGWRKGYILQDPETGVYYLLDEEEYEQEGGREKLMRTGGSGSYKMIGFLFGGTGNDRIMTNYRMRMGTQLENAVRAAYCTNNPNVVAEERGWINHDKIEGYRREPGMSPDGLLRDPGMTWEGTPDYRKEKWMNGWKKRGMTPKQIEAICADLPNRGLLEIKVTDGSREKKKRDGTVEVEWNGDANMSAYYMAQLTWNMFIKDLYWARLVKLNMHSGELRSFTVYRDFERERQHLEGVKATQKLKDNDPQLDLAAAAKCAEAKTIFRKMRASAWWFNENKDKCSKTLQWDVPVVRELMAWRRRTRRELAERGPPPTPATTPAKARKRVDEEAIPIPPDGLDQRMRNLINAQMTVTRAVYAEPELLQDAVQINIQALWALIKDEVAATEKNGQ